MNNPKSSSDSKKAAQTSTAVSSKPEEKMQKPEKKAEPAGAAAENQKPTEKQETKQKEQEAKQNKQEAKQKEQETKQEAKQKEQETKQNTVKLNSLFGFKVGMTNVYEKNQMVPVTVVQYKTARVTQIKTKEKNGYTAVQMALESSKKPNKAMKSHLKKASFKNRAVYIRESREPLPEGVKAGQEVSIESLQKGDTVFVSGISKGHGFSGVVKRWGFGGGPAAHGAEKHRTTGSIANTATQGRVFPGKKMPGHFGCDRITQKSRVVDVWPAQGALLIQGPLPGAKKSLVEIRKKEALR